ncbi:MAG: trehalose synthase [Thermoleophilaceae bacterium]|nr:trehalose synthase [Thermoleophilaceae bacterium]
MAFDVDISPMSIDRLRAVLSPDQIEAFDRGAEEARELLGGRVVWNVNSTARGGGVVELLQPLVAYARGAGVDARWVVIEGPAEFFELTKRIHNRLHGVEGDGPLDDSARRLYELVLQHNLDELAERVREGDVVIVHDPQPSGMIEALAARGASVVWRCHIGLDLPNEITRETWDFLLPYVRHADAYVFSRESFAWEGLDRDRIVVIPPSIDPFAPKNEELSPNTVRDVLRASGLISDGDDPGPVTFERQDGTPGRVERRAHLTEERPLGPDDPVVLQVSRWDALKDPLGVIRGFAEHVAPATGAHLVYAGPDVEAVADDPEGARMLREARALYAELPAEQRARMHLATLPMDDLEENAIIVNALQRHARVVVQKSLAEGFGLTVSEAMWKGRPVVASRIGGIQDQIVHGESGLLLDDPTDLAAYGAAVTELLNDPARATAIGERARERVRERFLSARSLLDYLALMRKLVRAPDAVAADASVVKQAVAHPGAAGR